MRVLMTGGYGCIGSWIIRNLLDRGDQVWVFDVRKNTDRLRLIVPEEKSNAVPFIEGDVANLQELRKALSLYGITHVIHLAGLQVPTCRADPMLGAQVNVLGTLAVFEAIRQSSPPIERLVYASSAAVYGAPDLYYPAGSSTPLSDSAPLIPSSHYGVFKCCNEGNARIYFADHGLSSIGLRPWTVYGVGRDFGMTSEPTKAIKSVALGRSYAISYGGMQDLQYVDDVAKTFIRALVAPYKGAKSYNLRGSVVDLATFHRALCQVAPEANDLVTFGNRQLGIAYDLDDSALEHDLGPMPKTPLDVGIRQTLEQFRALARDGRLSDHDLLAPPSPPTSLANEP